MDDEILRAIFSVHFGKFREYSVKIGNYKNYVCLPENVGYIPLTVVIIHVTTANETHPIFAYTVFYQFRCSLIFKHMLREQLCLTGDAVRTICDQLKLI